MATRTKDTVRNPTLDRTRMLHDLLKLTNRLMAPFSTHLADRFKISLNEFRLLMTIGALGTTASHEVADLTGVNVMSVSRAVSALERHGRITVVTDPLNRRRKALKLTEEGRRLYDIMRPQTGKVADYLFSELEPGELAMLERILDKLIVTLEERDAAGNSRFLEETRPD
ncbi:MAG: MarR family winged helix-turn-helix transcriptional regulator [Candidatus Andeanibacterium colombiense]|uniref:MarR family winged helix-turn-helix transcriptional regulator n=1 Tax=Candidatus Andeanibacterium colombiense TaxID=3121345 RepID=A0AAJ5X5E6_9SPHN|nr:MAG: MarR family winged helix-turn-helix transcriptional regulator [Sphingomonadaceae bacterium]